MKNFMIAGLVLIATLSIFAYTGSATTSEPSQATSDESPQQEELSSEFKEYWYAGDAEITSYELEQVRYGEVHAGKAVLVYVTEPFSTTKQVKADNPGKKDISVMKLNFTKKFNTGIYPYSMMTSTFVPIKEKQDHALKITTTSQEWCGHTFTQLNNRNGQFNIELRSYFESEGDQNFTLDKTITEDELWTQIRLDPEALPEGEQSIIPAFFYLRLRHQPLKAYKATAVKKPAQAGQTTYSINYPDLNRELSITFNNSFPHEIVQWEENYRSGWGSSAKKLTTKATKIKTLKTDYWAKNSNDDLPLRGELGL
jgi:hypothetical protein